MLIEDDATWGYVHHRQSGLAEIERSATGFFLGDGSFAKVISKRCDDLSTFLR